MDILLTAFNVLDFTYFTPYCQGVTEVKKYESILYTLKILVRGGDGKS
jgi:hypothetical protein